MALDSSRAEVMASLMPRLEENQEYGAIDFHEWVAPIPDFSYAGFRDILMEIKSYGYTFCRFDEVLDDGRRDLKRFYLRHDVDMSPRCASRLGRIAAECGLRSNVLFQLDAETYNVFAQGNLEIIRELRALGHCVGLQIDENLIGVDGGKILLTLNWFNECCASIDRVISFHRPTAACLGRDFEGFASGYGSRVFGKDRYLSDSRRSWEFRERLTQWLIQGRTPIQLLLHPGWWHPHNDVNEIWDDLRNRRNDDLARYMVANFRKVFASVIALDEQPDFGL